MNLDKETDAYKAALAAELRRLREDAGLSQTRLASDAGLTQPMIAFVEKEVKAPNVASLFRIARALGTTPGVILAAVDARIKPTILSRTKKVP